MQIDMHYYGTYAMARAAGLNPSTSMTIATCAQFVDDNTGDGQVEFDDGGRLDSVATAHHAADLENIDDQNQRIVWIPFHFIPGNEGDEFTERLVCRKDSAIAREMISNHLSQADKSFAAELMGVAAHVYMDTFSHYGFSGVSSRRNEVVGDSFEYYDLNPNVRNYIAGKKDSFIGRFTLRVSNIKSSIADLAALGHGGVLTNPDRPYLDWSFEYEYPSRRRERRNNPSTFFEGCEKLYGVFARFSESIDGVADGGGKPFEEIAEKVRAIIGFQGKCDERIAQWQNAASAGELFAAPETIPNYEGLTWNDRRDKLGEADQKSSAALSEPVFRFYQAAAYHRTYILRDLLPKHGIVAD